MPMYRSKTANATSLTRAKYAPTNTRQSSAEAPAKPQFLMFAFNLVLLLLPVDAKGRIGEKIVELFVRELVIGKAVAEANVVNTAVVVHLLHKHVGRGCSECALIVVLAIHVEPRGARVGSFALRRAFHLCRKRGLT